MEKRLILMFLEDFNENEEDRIKDITEKYSKT